MYTDKDEMIVYETMLDKTQVTLFIDLHGPLCSAVSVDHKKVEQIINKTKKQFDDGKRPFHLIDDDGITVGRIRYID